MSHAVSTTGMEIGVSTILVRGFRPSQDAVDCGRELMPLSMPFHDSCRVTEPKHRAAVGLFASMNPLANCDAQHLAGLQWLEASQLATLTHRD
jgi:hypothetical protein